MTSSRERYYAAVRLIAPAIVVAGVLAALWATDPREIRLPLCSFHIATGLDCPGCGATRATHDLLHGQWRSALQANLLWTAGLPLYAYVALSELRLAAGGRPLPGNLSRQRWFWTTLVLAALLFGLLRNLPGPLGAILAPA